jgi:hypothetical protein
MRSVKLMAGVVSSDRAVADRWYVTTGEGSVGPVNLDLLARGIEAGKVPLDSFVRNEAWTVWRPLSDIAMVTESARAPPTESAPASSSRSTRVGAPPSRVPQST